MEVVKINLTKEKVNKLINKAELNAPYVAPHSGFLTDNENKVLDVCNSLGKKLESKKVAIGNRLLLAANFGMSKTISTFFIDKGVKTVFSLDVEGVTVDLCYNEEHNAVELWWLEVQSKSAGKGTEIMCHLLDTIDELGLKLYLTPVPFATDGSIRTNKQYHNAFLRLRSWYESFEGFQRIKNSPSLIYA